MAILILTKLLISSSLFFILTYGQQTGQIQDDKKDYSLGLNVLSPAYSPKIEDGKVKYDYNNDKNSFSYSLAKSDDKSGELKSTASQTTSTISSNQRASDSGSNQYYSSQPTPIYNQGFQPTPYYGPYGQFYSSPFFPYRFPYYNPNQFVGANHGNPQSQTQQTASSTTSQVQQPGLPQPVSGQYNPYLGYPSVQLYNALYNYALQRYGQAPINAGLYGSSSANYPMSASPMSPPVYPPYAAGSAPYPTYQSPFGPSPSPSPSPMSSYLGPDAMTTLRSLYGSGSENYYNYLSPFAGQYVTPFSGLRQMSGLSGLTGGLTGGLSGLSGLSRLLG